MTSRRPCTSFPQSCTRIACRHTATFLSSGFSASSPPDLFTRFVLSPTLPSIFRSSTCYVSSKLIPPPPPTIPHFLMLYNSNERTPSPLSRTLPPLFRTPLPHSLAPLPYSSFILSLALRAFVAFSKLRYIRDSLRFALLVLSPHDSTPHDAPTTS